MQAILERLEAEVAALAAVPPSGLPVAALQGLVARTSRVAAQLEAIGTRALGELQVRTGGSVPDGPSGAVRPIPAWLRATTGVSGHAAGRRVRTAVALRELPLVQDAVVAGTITPEHGRVLTRLIGAIEPQALLDSQGPLLEVARRADPEQLAQFVRHQIATWCPPRLEDEEQAAEDRRFWSHRDTHRGSYRGSFDLPYAVMEKVLTVMEPLARRDGNDDKRSAGQRRADALADVFALALKHGDLPDAGGERPRLTYVLPPLDDRCGREFALDLDRHPGAHCPTGAWTGPATKALVETLQCDARTDRLTVDADGRIVSLEAFTDTITRAQRRAVAARDRCCVAKGCTRPPAFCDVHHLRALADGGATEVDNLVLLCRRHHVMWHRGQLNLTDLRVPWMRLPQPRAPSVE